MVANIEATQLAWHCKIKEYIILSYVFDEHIVTYCTWHVLQETNRISNVVG
jgi:hypothetical protein